MIRRALDEDLRYGPDVTTEATVAAGCEHHGSVVTRERGVIAGCEWPCWCWTRCLEWGVIACSIGRRRKPGGRRRRGLAGGGDDRMGC